MPGFLFFEFQNMMYIDEKHQFKLKKWGWRSLSLHINRTPNKTEKTPYSLGAFRIYILTQGIKTFIKTTDPEEVSYLIRNFHKIKITNDNKLDFNDLFDSLNRQEEQLISFWLIKEFNILSDIVPAMLSKLQTHNIPAYIKNNMLWAKIDEQE